VHGAVPRPEVRRIVLTGTDPADCDQPVAEIPEEELVVSNAGGVGVPELHEAEGWRAEQRNEHAGNDGYDYHPETQRQSPSSQSRSRVYRTTDFKLVATRRTHGRNVGSKPQRNAVP
jgi:hypothetical protein